MIKKILVVGDAITDAYRFCDSPRLCPEAPVPVLIERQAYNTLGGACLVTGNLRSLGLSVTEIVGSHSRKERFYVGTHLICRLDKDSEQTFDIREAVNISLSQADAVIVSDYCKGAVTEPLARQIVSSGLPCFVDTKNSHIEWFQGENVILFPNQNEYERHCAGREHLFRCVVEKRGGEGCRLHNAQYRSLLIPAAKRNVFDVVGAGDVFIAAFVWAWSQHDGNDLMWCARIANQAAGVSVERLGTCIVKPSDIKHDNRLMY